MAKAAEDHPATSPHLHGRLTPQLCSGTTPTMPTRQRAINETLGQQQSTSEWGVRRRILCGCHAVIGNTKCRHQQPSMSRINSATKSKPKGQELDPIWQDLDWAIGQLLIMGWDGTEVTPQIRSLIEDHHLGSIILTAKNLKSAEETAKLVRELQSIAQKAGHPQPLLIALDQENGGVNSLFDEEYVCQFPSAMGVAAAGRPELSYEVAKASATEVAACGINLMMGPVLDVLSNARHQPLGVRATSDDPQEVSQYAIAALRGVKDAGIAACGKHFPSYGNLDFRGSNHDMPVITQTLDELSLSALVPFRNAIATGKLDAMFVGGCKISNPSMHVNHACLSDQVVDELLRSDLGFNGVAISECLEMESLSHEMGVQNGVVQAVEAGCDLILLCRAYDIQKEAIQGLKLGIESGIISHERVLTSVRRVLRLKASCTNWNKALNPGGIRLLEKLHPAHLALSKRAYDDSITVIRDHEKLLPLSSWMRQDDELLLLTPLVKPLPASVLTKRLVQSKGMQMIAPTNHDKWVHPNRIAVMSGEEVFRELGRSIARARNAKLLHTSYTANGVRPVHENLIERASAIVVVTADANRNMYQAGFTKHVNMMCSMFRSRGQKKSLIVVAVSSPYDFALDKSISTYMCTFDFTENAMHALVRALFGEIVPRGSLPGTLRKSRKNSKSRQPWLVDEYDEERDLRGLNNLLKGVVRSSTPDLAYLDAAAATSFHLENPHVGEAHFVVRNSSTGDLYGFVSTYMVRSVGIIGAIFVDPSKRNASIGKCLHRRAIRSLNSRGATKFQLGCAFPGVFLGIPVDDSNAVKDWFAGCGWDVQFPRRMTAMTIKDLTSWATPEGLLQGIQRATLAFDLIHGVENAEMVLSLVAEHASAEVVELYRAALEASCGIVRAKAPGGSLLGAIIICKPWSSLATWVPAIASVDEPVGGILAPIIAPSSQATLVLQGLALLGIRQAKTQKASKVVLSWATEEMDDPLRAMGFEVLQAFEEIINSPDHIIAQT